MKIKVLAYLERENSRKHDVVVEQVAEGLRQGGHEVSVLGVHGDVHKMLNGLTQDPPELVFNLMEMFGKDLWGAIAVVGLLDLLDLPYTGGGPGEFYLQEDKGLTKKLLAFDGIRYPDFVVFERGAPVEPLERLQLPLIVKPLRGDASIGIDARSVVHSLKDMVNRVQSIHQRWNDDALVEEFIEGREFHVGLLGNENPQVFPAVEIDFGGLPDGVPRILDSKAKWKKDSVEYRGTNALVPELPPDLAQKVAAAALGAYRALRVRDYGRIDLRLSHDDEPYVIEVNASCYLDGDSEYAKGATAAGFDSPKLVNRIADLALERFRKGLAPVRRRRTRARAPESGPATSEGAAPTPA